MENWARDARDMGFKAQKSNRIRGEAFLKTYFAGDVPDIGSGLELVGEIGRPFDLEHGDANHVERYFAPESFDSIHGPNRLGYMRDVAHTLAGWWSLMKPGGYLAVIVPHEDLYEQGYWPSVFNDDHRVTSRLDKQSSWQPVSSDLPERA